MAHQIVQVYQPEVNQMQCTSSAQGAMFIERYVESPRHVEIQIIADGTNATHLFERDCSVQRRHQKIVEVAPSIGLPESLRESLYADAIRITKGAGYFCAGTVEFLVDPKTSAAALAPPPTSPPHPSPPPPSPPPPEPGPSVVAGGTTTFSKSIRGTRILNKPNTAVHYTGRAHCAHRAHRSPRQRSPRSSRSPRSPPKTLRIQVEHTVTEVITGVDLVQSQAAAAEPTATLAASPVASAPPRRRRHCCPRPPPPSPPPPELAPVRRRRSGSLRGRSCTRSGCRRRTSR